MIQTTTGTGEAVEALARLGACEEARKWLSTQPDAATAWRRCPRGDWLLWMLGRVAGPPDSDSRRALVACCREVARLAWPFVRDGNLATKIALCDHIVSEYVDRRADLEDIRAVRNETCAAAYAAAEADEAAYAAAYAADAAAYAAAYAAYADDATRRKILSRAATIVRRHYPMAPVWEALP
jgi:hypothetical protein